MLSSDREHSTHMSNTCMNNPYRQSTGTRIIVNATLHFVTYNAEKDDNTNTVVQ